MAVSEILWNFVKYRSQTSFQLQCMRRAHGSECLLIISNFLGTYIGNNLNWKSHIYYIADKIAKGIGIFTTARKYFKGECVISLYHSFIYPYLVYCNHIWGNTYKFSLSKLQVLQNKAMWIVTGSNPRTNAELLYENNLESAWHK